ncbi:type II toxin-antitoxin system VapC family toxin [Pseudorhodoplanes sinuspersici]|uniref:PIN domain-containing protein n=1 Tax=Pseudorhodoplanes sinuspersici TaxID=1235591 RepID=A0A1W6ZYF3_9HYPH|nr:type II toxin-antitoxin system VapC family toxin [Pseudorhodoplanes sinuspersici]ARQ01775.1 hypothetical protein CAK95_23760 [Pseudorhodoplanes sinuspersici]RKE73524.1 PIN domain nuclease of toxin-antitoxin system [Pseudorhodoplanes sinuspersici]
MSSPLLLDTCAAIFIAEGETLSKPARQALEMAFDDAVPVWISPISAWEIGLLVARGRLRLQIAPQVWFRRLRDDLNFLLADMPPDVLIASSDLPESTLRDPADRIIVATAREYGYRIVTRDNPILQYAANGHVQALGC